MSKYGNRKTVMYGHEFDSYAEAERYSELLASQRVGVITYLSRQPVFILAQPVKIKGEKRTRPALRYIADFTYFENGRQVVEDVKSAATAKLPAFRMKQHLMKTVHGIDVQVVK